MSLNIYKLIDKIRNLSIKGTEGVFNIQPFIVIYLYALDKIKFVKVYNIDELYKTDIDNINNDIIISYKDLNTAWEKGSMTKEELDDYNNNIDAYALIYRIDKRDKTDIYIYLAAKKTLDILRKEEKFYYIANALFELYSLLSSTPRYKIKENLYEILSITLDYSFYATTPIQDYYKIRNQKSCNELTRLIIRLLNIDNKDKDYSVCNLMAGPANYIECITDNILYNAKYKDVRYGCLYSIFSSAAGKKVACSVVVEKEEVEDCQENSVIIDDISLGREIWNYIAEVCFFNKSGVFLVESDALYGFNNKISNGLEILEKKVSHIIFLPEGLAIIKVSDIPKKTKGIMLFDETESYNIDSNKIINDIELKQNSFILTDEDYRSPDFVFGLNQILSKKERIKVINNSIDGVLISEILSPSSTVGHKINHYTLNTYDANYSKFLPFYKVEDEILYRISEEEAFESDFNRILLLDLIDNSKYQPKIICYNKLESSLSIDEFAFEIKEDIIDYNYLISEMNQDYFIKQLFPTNNKNHIAIDWCNLSNCYIKLPKVYDSSTPLKRQQLYVNREKLKFINELQLSYGYNIDNVNKNRKRLKIKTTLKNGRYEIKKYISSGGFGITYQAIDYHNNQIVAIKEFFYSAILYRENDNKVFVPANRYDEYWLCCQKFMTEARKIKKLDSDKIIKVFDVFDENNTCYYTMEYIDGCNLNEYVRNKYRLKEEEAIRIIRSIGESLKIMHDKETNHFDVKPQNIMMSNDGRIVLIDFGAAHHCNNNFENNTYLAYRSKGFSAPYIPQDHRCYFFSPTYDIYSLGATLYFMLTGLEPIDFNDDSCPPFVKKLKSWECIKMSLSIDKKDCQKSIDEFLAMLPS